MTDAPPPYPGINGYSSGGYLGAGGFVSPPGPTSSTGGAQAGAAGFTPNASDAKAAEAAGLQTGYVDPNNPQMAYLPQVIELTCPFKNLSVPSFHPPEKVQQS